MKKENKKKTVNKSQTSKLNSEQLRNLLLLLFLPFIVIATWTLVSQKATDIANTLPLVNDINKTKQVIDNNRDVFQMLKAIRLDYVPRNIFEGIAAQSFQDFFIPPVKPKEQVIVQAAAPARPTETVATPQVVTQPMFYPDSVTFIFSGQERSYAIIDGKLLRKGDTTLSGYQVSKIENNKVFLIGKRGSKWVTVKF